LICPERSSLFLFIYFCSFSVLLFFLKLLVMARAFFPSLLWYRKFGKFSHKI
jgi:hypothetical protein